MSDHGHFSFYEGHKERRTEIFVGLFQGCTGLWTAGCWLTRRLHQLKAYTTMCVCVFFSFILDIKKFVGRTSRGHTGGRSHMIFHPPSFCGARLNFSREKDSAIPFPRRP